MKKRALQEKVRDLESEREGWRDWIRFLQKNLRQIRDKLDSWPVGTCWPEGRKQIRDLTGGCEDTHWDEAALDVDPEYGPYPSINSPEVKVAAGFTTEILREMVNRAQENAGSASVLGDMCCGGNCGPTENCPIWESWEHTGEVNRKLREKNESQAEALTDERRRKDLLLASNKGYREEIASLSKRLTDEANAHEADVLNLQERIEVLVEERVDNLKAIDGLRRANEQAGHEILRLQRELKQWEQFNQEKLDEMRLALAEQGGWSTLRSRAFVLRQEVETLRTQPLVAVSVNGEAPDWWCPVCGHRNEARHSRCHGTVTRPDGISACQYERQQIAEKADA